MAQRIGCVAILVLGFQLGLANADRPVKNGQKPAGEDLDATLKKIAEHLDRGASLFEEQHALAVLKAANSATAADADNDVQEAEHKADGDAKSGAEDKDSTEKGDQGNELEDGKADEADTEAASSATAADADNEVQETEHKAEGEAKSGADDEAEEEATISAMAADVDGEAQKTEQLAEGDAQSGAADEASTEGKKDEADETETTKAETNQQIQHMQASMTQMQSSLAQMQDMHAASVLSMAQIQAELGETKAELVETKAMMLASKQSKESCNRYLNGKPGTRSHNVCDWLNYVTDKSGIVWVEK